MRSIFGVCLALVLIARLAECLRGGRWARKDEFPFLVKIEKSNHTWCLGSILDSDRIIFPDDCLRNSPLVGYASANVIPIVNEAPPKKYAGRFVNTAHSAINTEFNAIAIHLEPPGLKLAEWNQQNVSLPQRVIIGRRIPGKSNVVVVGLNRRVGAMTLLNDFECFNRLGKLYFPMNDRLQSTKVLLGEKLMCAVLANSTGNVGNIPPGQACERDLGAPVLQDGAVVGMVVRSFCLENFPPVVLILRLDHSDETRKRLVRNESTLEQNPLSPQESERVKRQTSIENEIQQKPKDGNETQSNGCEAPAKEAAASGSGGCTPNDGQLPVGKTLPESSHPNDEIAKRLRGQSMDIKNGASAGNGIECHECKEPSTKVEGSEDGAVNPREAASEEKLLYDKASIPSGEVAKMLIRQSHSMINDAFHKVTASVNPSETTSSPNDTVLTNVKRPSRDMRNYTEILEKSSAGSESQCHESSCVPKPRVTRDAAVPVSNKSYGHGFIEDNISSHSEARIAGERHRVHQPNYNRRDEINKNIQTGIVHRSLEGSDATVEMKHNVEVFIPIPEENSVEQLVREMKEMNRKQRHRRGAASGVAASPNATAPGANSTSNTTGNATSALNGTGSLNETKPMMNGTAVKGNATTKPGGNIDVSKGNASVSVTALPINGTNNTLAVNSTSTAKVTGRGHGNETLSKNGSKPHDGAGEMGSGRANETDYEISSSGDYFDLGNVSGSGDETSGSGDVEVYFESDESAQEENHMSEEEFGPEKKPTQTTKSKPRTTTEESPAPNDLEEQPVGPPEPNDDRPDYTPPPGKPKARQANSSFQNIPFCYSLLATISFIISFI